MSTIFKLPVTALLSLITTTAIFTKGIMINKSDLKEATLIELTAQQNKSNNLKNFLKEGAALVKKHEPNTKLWFALQENDDTFAIFDVFPDNDARSDHFAGKVANALQSNAPSLIKGGWDNGVLANVNNFEILSVKSSTNLSTATEATFILLHAAPGQEKNLANLLTAAADIVTKTEPKTLFWTALKFDNNTYAIFDTFTDESGRTAHFAGQVASLLKEKAVTLVDGGWDNGVLPNIHNYKIIATK